jgi:hypothetical protein
VSVSGQSGMLWYLGAKEKPPGIREYQGVSLPAVRDHWRLTTMSAGRRRDPVPLGNHRLAMGPHDYRRTTPHLFSRAGREAESDSSSKVICTRHQPRP